MTDDSTASSMSERSLQHAKERLDQAVIGFSEAAAVGENRTLASAELHVAVIGLFWKMRYFLQDSKMWEKAEKDNGREYLWQGIHPQTNTQMTIEGLRDLGDWIDKSVTVSTQNKNKRTGAETEEKQLLLPAPAALTAASLLLDIYHEYGWGAESRGKSQLFQVENKDRFKEPVHDDIPKPE